MTTLNPVTGVLSPPGDLGRLSPIDTSALSIDLINVVCASWPVAVCVAVPVADNAAEGRVVDFAVEGPVANDAAD